MTSSPLRRMASLMGPARLSPPAASSSSATGRNRKRHSPIAALYLVAFSAVVTYFYDEALVRRSDFHFKQGVMWDERAKRWQPSEEQMEMARRLKLRDRLLATTKEAWPECMANSMNAIECKEFIDYEILTLFTDEDRFIRTRIIGKRSTEDDWYNAVSIVMDDNNAVLGKDGDGWIYYNFEWEGSGQEATAEQQAAIPPVTAEETTTGSTGGDAVTTVNTADPLDAFDPIDTSTSNNSPPATVAVEDFVQTTAGPATTAVVTTAITTTITTVTVPPMTTIAPGTTTPAVESFVTEPPGVEGGIITTVPPGDPFAFDEAPVVPEEEPILVEGATTDGAMAGNDTNPLNGGVVLEGATTDGGEAQRALENSLDEPPNISPAGSRVIGPWDCRGLTGFECCIKIKHDVRDADINDRAIQCHLDYADTTCKKEWWIATESSKKVLIYANENEMVIEDPVITGSWPQCDEVWTDTRDWNTATSTTEETRCGKDFGDAVCPNDQCCSAAGYCGTGGAWCDFGCQSNCWTNSDESGISVDRERCGSVTGGKVCHGTYCCSSTGFCGSGAEYCEASQGCQSNCWVSDGDGTVPADVELPPTIAEECKGSANVCIAVDMSGSVCSPNFSSPSMCSNCDSSCKQDDYDENTCCANFSNMKDFGISVVNWMNHLQFGVNRNNFSLVTFASTAATQVTLGQDVLQGLSNMDYTGGLTNHGSAIDQCQNSFSGTAGQNFILLVTDGVATSSTGFYSPSAGESHGKTRATAAKDAGTIIETVFINPDQASESVKTYMNSLSSSGTHHDIGSFESLGTEVNDVAYKLACSGNTEADPNTSTPSATEQHTAAEASAAQAETQAASTASAGGEVSTTAEPNSQGYYCNCETCTQEVWDTKYNKWFKCGQRIEWMMSWPRSKTLEWSCALTAQAYSECIPCDCNYDGNQGHTWGNNSDD